MQLAVSAMVGLMVTSVSQTAHKYITLPRIRRKGSRHLWAWTGSILAVCAMLSLYGATNANASNEMSCDDLLGRVNMALMSFERDVELANKVMKGDAQKKHEAAEQFLNDAKNARRIAAEWATIYTAICK